jgi:hypothetical protein
MDEDILPMDEEEEKGEEKSPGVEGKEGLSSADTTGGVSKNIQVMVRVRPLIGTEKGQQVAWKKVIHDLSFIS